MKDPAEGDYGGNPKDEVIPERHAPSSFRNPERVGTIGDNGPKGYWPSDADCGPRPPNDHD